MDVSPGLKGTLRMIGVDGGSVWELENACFRFICETWVEIFTDFWEHYVGDINII